jgi:hypothetical protein
MMLGGLLMPVIKNGRFYCKNKDNYPPFKDGLYLEEYFLQYMEKLGATHNAAGRRYIPALWTNFQIEGWFQHHRDEMQRDLDEFVRANPCDAGYFVVVQMDDGVLLRLPPNTIVYGACCGNIPIPLIYEDRAENLLRAAAAAPPRTTDPFVCSFVGTLTHDVRRRVVDYSRAKKYKVVCTDGWTASVDATKQMNFIEATQNSVFSLAPRGYGLSSFRFFEILKLGGIPIYVWDTVEWLPYKDVIDYNKFCISINVAELETLDDRIAAVVARGGVAEMRAEYEKIKYVFEMDFMGYYVFNHSQNTLGEYYSREKLKHT